jgi:hypothetical protein
LGVVELEIPITKDVKPHSVYAAIDEMVGPAGTHTSFTEANGMNAA